MKRCAQLCRILQCALGKALSEHNIKRALGITIEETCNTSKVASHFYTAVKALL